MRKTVVFLIILSLGVCTVTAEAKPRSLAQKRQAAAAVFRMHEGTKLQANGNIDDAPLRLLAKPDANLSVLGFEEGGFAVVADDDLLPAVLGYSDSRYPSEEENPAFHAWLREMQEAAKAYVRKGKPRPIIKPDADRFMPAVPALLLSQWGQYAPFNNDCPVAPYRNGGGSGRSIVGCVATSMAQVMYYHKFPQTGTGTAQVGVPLNNPQTYYKVNFSEANYDWDNMLTSYTAGGYTEEQAAAVAQLCYHCGVAVGMEYAPDGSGAYNADAANALRNYFRYPYSVTALSRSNYSEAQWMDLVFGELSALCPIIYGAVDRAYGGHSFVIDGYDEAGRVHVNWGWNGRSDGYFDISLLNPDDYQFSTRQDMVIGIRATDREVITDEITVGTPGQLSELCPADRRDNYFSLKVTGDINSTDLKVIREMAGRDDRGNATPGSLAYLDLSEARFVSGGEPFLTDGHTNFSTAENTLPERAFYGTMLSSIKLPHGITTIGDGAFGSCPRLSEVKGLENGDDRQFFIDDGIVYTADGLEVVCILPQRTGEVVLPRGVTRLHDYAFDGALGVYSLSLPSSLTALGVRALYGCINLRKLKTYAATPPDVGRECFDHIDLPGKTLLVMIGCRDAYLKANGWKTFFDQGGIIADCGTIVRARNAARNYGEENPRFGYQLQGEYVEGEPVLCCEATPVSLPGKYPIHVEMGTIDADGVILQDGYLVVKGEVPTGISDNNRETINNNKYATTKDRAVYDLQGRVVGRISKHDGNGNDSSFFILHSSFKKGVKIDARRKRKFLQ